MPHTSYRLVHILFSLDAGGMENGIINVVNRLDPTEFEVHIICLERFGAFRERLAPHIHLHLLNRKQGGVSLELASRLHRLLGELRPDLVRTHNLGTLVYGMLATAFGRRFPVIHSEHGKLLPHELTFRKRWQRRLLYIGCRRVLTVSTELAKGIAPLAVDAGKVVAIRNGVDTGFFSPGSCREARLGLGFPAEGRYIGLIGRLVAFKRHREMIEAFNMVAARLDDLHLLLVGNDGPMREEVETVITRSPYRERIHLLPFLNDPRPYYRALDLLVLPSSAEGLANVVLEGMACGLPVLTHVACGNREVAGEGRYAFVEEMDTVEQIAARVSDALEQPEELGQLGRRARRNAEQNLSIGSMVRAYAEVYREVLTRNRWQSHERQPQAKGCS